MYAVAVNTGYEATQEGAATPKTTLSRRDVRQQQKAWKRTQAEIMLHYRTEEAYFRAGIMGYARGEYLGMPKRKVAVGFSPIQVTSKDMRYGECFSGIDLGKPLKRKEVRQIMEELRSAGLAEKMFLRGWRVYIPTEKENMPIPEFNTINQATRGNAKLIPDILYIADGRIAGVLIHVQPCNIAKNRLMQNAYETASEMFNKADKARVEGWVNSVLYKIGSSRRAQTAPLNHSANTTPAFTYDARNLMITPVGEKAINAAIEMHRHFRENYLGSKKRIAEGTAREEQAKEDAKSEKGKGAGAAKNGSTK